MEYKSIELYNPTKEEFFEVKLIKVLTGKIYNKLVDIEKEYKNIEKEANMLIMLAETNPEALKSISKGKNDVLDKVIEGILDKKYSKSDIINLMEMESPEISKNNISKKIDTLKIVIDYSSLKPEEKKLINSDSKKTFWLNQDIIKIKEIADSFRKIIQ